MTWEVTQGALPAGLTLSLRTGRSRARRPRPARPRSRSRRRRRRRTSARRASTRSSSRSTSCSAGGRASRTVAEVGVRFRATLVPSAVGRRPYTWSATGAPAGPHGRLRRHDQRRADTRGLVHRDVASRRRERLGRRRPGQARRPGEPRDRDEELCRRQRRAALTGRRSPSAAASRPCAGRGRRLASRRSEARRGTGTIAGVPSSAGTFRVTLRVRDSLGAVSTKTLLLRVH